MLEVIYISHSPELYSGSRRVTFITMNRRCGNDLPDKKIIVLDGVLFKALQDISRGLS